MLEKIFKLKENGTTLTTEAVAGLTTFFTMGLYYRSESRPVKSVRDGMGRCVSGHHYRFHHRHAGHGTVCECALCPGAGDGIKRLLRLYGLLRLGFTWQQALSMVFLCGLINILITVTRLRKSIIRSIPPSLQNAIGGGIGLFVAYIGFLNAGILTFDSGVPALALSISPLFGCFSWDWY